MEWEESKELEERKGLTQAHNFCKTGRITKRSG